MKKNLRYSYEGLKDAFVEAEVHLWSKEEYAEYDNYSMSIQDRRGEMEFALAKAERIAKEKAEKKAEEKEISVVFGCYENGIPISIIAKSLKITEERVLEILNLKNE